MPRRENFVGKWTTFFKNEAKIGYNLPKIKNDKKNAILGLKVTKNAKQHFPKFSDIWTPKTSRFGVSATIWSHCKLVKLRQTRQTTSQN